MTVPKDWRARVAALLLVAFLGCVLIGLAVYLGSRTYCVGECRGRWVECTDLSELVHAARSRGHHVRLRCTIREGHPRECGDADWEIAPFDQPLIDAYRRAEDHGQPVVLSLRYYGVVADADYSVLRLVGLEVRGTDDWRSALEAAQ